MSLVDAAKTKKPLFIIGVFLFLQALISLGIVGFTVVMGLSGENMGEIATAMLWLIFGAGFAFGGLSCFKYSRLDEKAPGKLFMNIAGIWLFVYGFLAQMGVNVTIFLGTSEGEHWLLGYALLLQIFSGAFVLGGIMCIHYSAELKNYKSAFSFGKALAVIDGIIVVVVFLLLLLMWEFGFLLSLLCTLGALVFLASKYVLLFIGTNKNEKEHLAFLETQVGH